MNRSYVSAYPVVGAEYAPERVGGRNLFVLGGGQQGVSVPLSALSVGESPRLNGRDEAHIARLSEIEGPLPPILVDRRTMRIIDGTHRFFAALAKGQTTIDVEFFEGAEEDVFLRAVEANVKHGFPLSRADRRAAAARIMLSHPHMSDRAIAEVAGLGAKTVASIRWGSGEKVPYLTARMGRDGRVRPLDAAEGRRRAAEVLAEQPHASLRAVASVAGVSPATVADVRKRLSRGEAPVPAGVYEIGEDDGPDPAACAPDAADRAGRPARAVEPEPAAVLAKLLKDPSLRHKEDGRQLLHLLQRNAIALGDWSQMVPAVPSHSERMVAQLARHYAQLWSDFAQELERHPAPDVQPRRDGGCALGAAPGLPVRGESGICSSSEPSARG